MMVKRASDSWTYIYVVLGFALSIEGTIIQMIDVIKFPSKLIVYFVVGGVTVFKFLFSGSFQNRLIGWKASYENVERDPR